MTMHATKARARWPRYAVDVLALQAEVRARLAPWPVRAWRRFVALAKGQEGQLSATGIASLILLAALALGAVLIVSIVSRSLHDVQQVIP